MKKTMINSVSSLRFEQVWPVELIHQVSGRVLVSFPDVPEALTEGNGEQDALKQAQDCLAAALGGYISMLRTIPRPQPAKSEHSMISLPTHLEAKIALYNSMLALNVSNARLADQMSVSEDYVLNLIDLDQNTPIGQIETALHILR